MESSVVRSTGERWGEWFWTLVVGGGPSGSEDNADSLVYMLACSSKFS